MKPLNVKFDIMIDDGPHTLESMISFIEYYLPMLADDGIFVIEDVQSIDWIDTLADAIPDDMKQFIEIYDLRENKGRYDDIIFVVNKNNTV